MKLKGVDPYKYKITKESLKDCIMIRLLSNRIIFWLLYLIINHLKYKQNR